MKKFLQKEENIFFVYLFHASYSNKIKIILSNSYYIINHLIKRL